ncbi:hypothetical protein NGF19_23490 [Streptomyces sp. RY43-2]|uniref:Uncharacterized protein n=1 Tax=Streptomyces macrolidinus TaxID=2952607 RepID=A0ABT0ZJF2_9ACTN|nr:hypothetical protein [Streptomyces macrolidinus]MCN9243714.1 hypothetical protein [Streptomyces macrolidinus]
MLCIREALPDPWFRKEDVGDWARDPCDPTGLHVGVHAPDLSGLLFNCRATTLDQRADDHTVLVYVRRGHRDGAEERHASWLAEQIGRSVIGPPQEL